MLLRTITLSNSGNVCLDGGGYILALGYECNRGIYQLQLRPTGEWDGLTIRACWHLPDGTSTTTLAVDGYVDVPAAVTALPGTGCITFEGAAEGKTITSSDLRYLVGDNSGVEDGTLPEPNTPAWEQLVGTVAESAAQAEEAADRADKAAAAAEGMLTAVEETVSKALTDITHTGAAQTQAVTQAGEQAVQEVDAAAQAGVGSVEQAQKTATQTIQTAATAAIQQVEQTGGTQVQAVTAAGAGQVKKIEDAAAEKLEGITQLAGQAEDSATKAEQAAQRAEDAAAATSVIIDDTAITSTQTWSSKGIVDTLCPPIQATGNPVVCYPVPGYPLGVTVDFAPIQEGEGDPSPDNIRPIKGRDNVTVERCGENLIDIRADLALYDGNKSFSNSEKRVIKPHILAVGISSNNYFHENNIESYTISDGRLQFKPKVPGYGLGVGVMLTPGKTYSIGWNKSALTLGAINVAYYAEDGTYLSYSENNTFTVPLDAVYSVIVFRGNNEADVTITFEDIVLVPGTTAPTTYSPYTGQTTTLTLPTPCYGGTVDSVSGESKSEYLKYTANGTEKFVFNDRADGTQYFSAIILQIPNVVVDVGESIKTELCSHYPIDNPYMYKKACVWLLNQKVNYLRISDPRFSTVEELKSYLSAQYAAGTPVQITYKLEKPIPITATGGKPIPALAGTNTLLTDGDSLTVTGRTDPTHEMQQLRAAVVALGGTI